MKPVRRVFITLLLVLALVIPILTFPNIASAATVTIGWSTGDATNPRESGRLDANKFKYTGTEAGTLTKIGVLVDDGSASGNVRMGVYSNVDGHPGALLSVDQEVAVHNGLVEISGLNVPVVPDTYYWLVFALDTMNGIRYHNYVAGDELYSYYFVPQAYGPLPATYPLGSDPNAVWEKCKWWAPAQYCMQATIETGPSGPSTPVAIDTLPPTGISGTAATFNGNLTSLGSNSSVDVSFQYRTAGVFLWSSTATYVETKNSTGAFQTPWSPLQLSTKYYVRAVALDHNTGSIIATGAVLTFVTPPIRVRVTLMDVTCNVPNGDVPDKIYLRYSIYRDGWLKNSGDTLPTVNFVAGQTNLFNILLLDDTSGNIDSSITVQLEAYDQWGATLADSRQLGPAKVSVHPAVGSGIDDLTQSFRVSVVDYTVRYRITRVPAPY